MTTKQHQLQSIVWKYRMSGSPWPAEARVMAEWAMEAGLYRPHPQAAVRQCAKEIARALREEYHTDEKNRRVRTMHAVRSGQTVLWDDVRTAPRLHMQVAFQQRRERIVDDCRQLKTDVDSYNDSNPERAPIQLVFDFTEDLAELEVLSAA